MTVLPEYLQLLVPCVSGVEPAPTAALLSVRPMPSQVYVVTAMFGAVALGSCGTFWLFLLPSGEHQQES